MSNNKIKESVINMRARTTRLEHEGDYWTPEEIDKLRAHFDNGIGITTIAVMLQRTEPAIMQQIEKLDLYNRKSCPRRQRNKTAKRDANRGMSCCCLCDRCTVDPKDCPRRKAYLSRLEEA